MFTKSVKSEVLERHMADILTHQKKRSTAMEARVAARSRSAAGRVVQTEKQRRLAAAGEAKRRPRRWWTCDTPMKEFEKR